MPSTSSAHNHSFTDTTRAPASTMFSVYVMCCEMYKSVSNKHMSAFVQQKHFQIRRMMSAFVMHLFP